MKKTIILIFIVVFFAGVFLYLRSDKNSDDTSKENSNIQITNFEMEGRIVLKKINDILIGNNIKELENGFYDIKISNLSQGIDIYLNKLWYENYDEDYIQEEYLARICRELARQIGNASQTEDFEYVLYKYIKDNYMKVRRQEKVQALLLEKINMNFEWEDSIVKLLIRSNE